MSFLAPFMLGVGAFAAAVAVALHLLTTRRPPVAVLPTARFVPESDSRAVSRSSRPTDLLLLASRLLAALLLGAAFARPVLDAPGPSVRSVVMLDRSASVADADAAARIAVERLTEGGALVVFDTVARESTVDSLMAPGPARASHGILSAALVAAGRAARRVARGADSVRLVLVSPLAGEEFDAATDALRADWPGGLVVVRVDAAVDTARGVPVKLVSPLADDPLAPALARLPLERGAHEVRVVREEPSSADSAWARAAGRVLVHWPLVGDALPIADGVTAFGLRAATLVAPLVRLPLGDGVTASTGPSRRAVAPASASGVAPNGHAVARWRDGAAATFETAIGAGCVRRVAVGIPLAGDLTLRPPFDGFLSAMVEPCGGARGEAVSDSVAQAFAGGTQAASARSLAAGMSADTTIAALLLALALVALGAEWLLRRRSGA